MCWPSCFRDPQRTTAAHRKTEDKPTQYPSVVIAVEDIRQHMIKVEKGGGRVLGEPWDIPGVGLYVSFLDTEGNRVGMIQPTMNMQKS